MDHVAIMKPSWRLTEKVLSGEKRVESRWRKNKTAPWDKVKAGDTVYFKDSGSPVRLKACVEKVLQFSGLTPDRVKGLLDKYGRLDGIEDSEKEGFFRLFRDKRYCILVFLKGARETGPFGIDKTGFGAMSAWVTVDRIERIKKESG